jgi:hypothetical protein
MLPATDDVAAWMETCAVSEITRKNSRLMTMYSRNGGR